MVQNREITYNLHKLVFLLDKMADKSLIAKMGISFSLFRMLMAINNKSVSQKEIAKFWDMTEAAVSRQVEPLIEKGLILCEENEENRRENVLTLSNKGMGFLKKSYEIVDKEYENLYQKLSVSQRGIFSDGLRTLLKSVCNSTIDVGHESCKST